MRVLYNAVDWTSFSGFTQDNLNPYTNINIATRTKFARNYVPNNATLVANKNSSIGNSIALVFNRLIYPFLSSSAENNCLLVVNSLYYQVYSSAFHLANRGIYYFELPQNYITSLNISFSFASNGLTTYSQISNLFHGNYLSLANNGFDLSFTFEYIDKTDKVYNDYNVAFTQTQKTSALRIDLSIKNMNKTELDSILAWINTCGKSKPFVLFVDESETIITSKYQLGGMFMFHDVDKVHHKSFGLYDISFSIIEVL
jgi:hypothetical protein